MPDDPAIIVYNGRYHGGWAELHPSDNTTIAVTPQHINVQIATRDKGLAEHAIGAKLLQWSAVKSLHIKQTSFGSAEIGYGHYSEITITLANDSKVLLDIPNVEPLDVWEALDRVPVFRSRIPDNITALLAERRQAPKGPPTKPAAAPVPRRDESPKRGFARKGPLLVVLSVFAAFAVAGGLLANSLFKTSSAKYETYLQGHVSEALPVGGWGSGGWGRGGSVELISPSVVRVYFTIQNVGKGSGSPTCQITAGDPSSPYYGFQTFYWDKSIPAGGQLSQYQDITITQQGAAHVAQVSLSC